jgi:type IV pilus assembly protein PilA
MRSNATPRGFTLLEILIVVAIIALVAAMAIPNLIQARKYANEGSAIESLRTLATAEEMFKSQDCERDTRFDYGTLSELSATQLIDGILGSGTKAGFVFQAGYSTTSSEALWFSVANPILPGATADRSFEINQSGTIYYTTGGLLNLNVTNCRIDTTVIPIGK